ncbi:MAG: methionine--tRNA ligase [Planctomycetes bacterium]|nr:methionine--tRNA ligase [Planctomycetota bacterium]
MNPAQRPWYVTTPIYYVNDRPHIGHCFTTLVADAAARFERLLRGVATPAAPSPTAAPAPVFFLTGTDEHADKVVTSAEAHQTTPQAWADRNAAEFAKAFAAMGFANDDFIRTTEARHKEKVPRYIEKMVARGDVYRGEYTGWYDAGQEEYLTETAAKEQGFKSAVSGKPLEKRTEPCWFFRLSKFAEPLQRHLEANPRFVQPDARRAEVLGRIKLGLNDVPISRPVTDDPATQWGVRMPGDPASRVYVWIDALFNYLTAVDTPERRHLWPPAVQLLGKDILWFHAVIWPALLLSIGEELPGTIWSHGWWLSEGRKMSKSLGNFIAIEQLDAYARRYSLDALRWYLLTQGPLGANDADFVHAKFVEVFNADLANGIGNCTSRVGNMIGKYFEGKLPLDAAAAAKESRVPGYDWPALVAAAVAKAAAAHAAHDLPGALAPAGELVKAVDGYINVTQPFKVAKLAPTDPAKRAELAAILANCAEALRVAALLLSPAMPSKMAQVLREWSSTPPAGVPLAELARLDGPHSLRAGTAIAKGEILFLRADPAEAAPSAG